MLRRSGFKRPAYEAQPPAPLRRVERSGTYVGSLAAATPKTEILRNPRVLRLARDEPCQLQVDGVCNNDLSTTVACHSNLAEHGKAGARKADDCYVVFGCSACHSWLDQGGAGYEEKRSVFLQALRRQLDVWRRICNDMSRTVGERDAASWALRYLVDLTG